MTPEKLEETINRIIRFYNDKTKTRHKVSCEANREIVKECLEKTNNNVSEIMVFIDENSNKYYNLVECLKNFKKVEYTEDIEHKTEPTKENSQSINNAMELLSEAVVNLINKQNAEKIEKEIMSSVKETINNFIKEEYGSIQRKTTLIVNNEPVTFNEVLHEKFDEVLKFVANKEPVFLTGKAGTGKNVICKQVAKALGLDFYFSNAVTQEYKITGFTDAMGVYHETQFYKAFKNGGLFMLDEMDASIPEVLIILNSAIANGYFDFPAPIGYVEAHENFRVVGAGNTYGLGADYEYVGRNQLDMASLDRFAVVKIDYSPEIEMAISNNNTELLEFVREFRKASELAGIKALCSYRGIGRIEKMSHILDLEETLKTCLLKNLGKDELNNIYNRMQKLKNNKYFETFGIIAEQKLPF